MRKKRFSEGQWLPQLIQESKAAVDPGFPCATAEKFLEQKSLASLGRKEMKSGPPEAIAAPSLLLPPPLSFCFLALEMMSHQGRRWCPTRNGSGTQRAAHRQMATLAKAEQTLMVPGPVLSRAEEQRAFMGCNPGQREKNGQVYAEAGSHGGKEQEEQAWLAQGLGSGLNSQGGRQSLAASEGPICAICQLGGQAF